ncbi:isoprenylcysteine carboxylmethyltransferase family protein [Ideonella sp. 4Y16]|uniref:Isoprenylcysteine carboxylmethyltransferase family protein n=1 Tax=Ideonella alba TaxID=2824118 RepID=A0A941BE03_9BURK|nr:isoprenylcysteine carboxylmethyltransferase family protein [Ideonella alba]MBQ0933555.1 isoprenylcysteine carboxylmethyltransferase family protein [Ideonella alba]MBQ0946556.1 isoprenylcysteine carboxylmethyltransferase family protein [Ideonella alba]
MPSWLVRLGLVNIAGMVGAVLAGTPEGWLALALFDVWFLSELRLEVRSGTSSGAEEDRGSRMVLTVIRDVSLLAPVWWATQQGPAVVRPATMIVGLLAFALGLGIRLGAMRCLGSHFTMALTRQAHHTLLTEGLYRRMRHPGYLGLILIYGSFSFVCGLSDVGVVVALVSLAGMLYRIRLEERLLLHTFGGRYVDYRRRTWALFPRFGSEDVKL